MERTSPHGRPMWIRPSMRPSRSSLLLRGWPPAAWDGRETGEPGTDQQHVGPVRIFARVTVADLPAKRALASSPALCAKPNPSREFDVEEPSARRLDAARCRDRRLRRADRALRAAASFQAEFAPSTSTSMRWLPRAPSPPIVMATAACAVGSVISPVGMGFPNETGPVPVRRPRAPSPCANLAGPVPVQTGSGPALIRSGRGPQEA